MELRPPPLKLIVGCLVPDRAGTKSSECGPGDSKANSKAGGQEGPSPPVEQKRGAHAPLFHDLDLLVGIARLHLGGLRTNRERILFSRKSDLVQGFLAVGIEHGYR
jgi:hypothetical protein